MNPKTMGRIEAAVWAAARVFAYAACVSLSIAVAAQAVGHGNQVPDLTTLRGWGVSALYDGGVAVVAFGKNMLAPRSQIVSK